VLWFIVAYAILARNARNRVFARSVLCLPKPSPNTYGCCNASMQIWRKRCRSRLATASQRQDLQFDVTPFRTSTHAQDLYAARHWRHSTTVNPSRATTTMQRVILLRSLRFATLRASPIRTLNPLLQQRPFQHPQNTRSATQDTFPVSPSSQSPADIAIEDITELYATAQDEFEIAMEETEKMSVYAEEDRKAAREELTRVQEAYKSVVEGQDKQVGEEVQKRIGQRIRELEQGVLAMEEMAQNQD